MFNVFANSVIDAVQSAKKASVDYIPHKDLKETFVDLINFETEFTKKACAVSTNFYTRILEIAMDRSNYEEMQKSFEQFLPGNVVAYSKKAK